MRLNLRHIISRFLQFFILLMALFASPWLSAQSKAAPPRHLKCWLLCRHPPRLSSAQQALMPELSRRQRPLGWWARNLAFLTTPFKQLGIQGWHDYPFSGTISGVIYQIAKSNDGFCTIDVRVKSLQQDRSEVDLIFDYYLRLELSRSVGREICRQVHKNDTIIATGKFLWDGDGFLEIHPFCVERHCPSGLNFLL